MRVSASYSASVPRMRARRHFPQPASPGPESNGEQIQPWLQETSPCRFVQNKNANSRLQIARGADKVPATPGETGT